MFFWAPWYSFLKGVSIRNVLASKKAQAQASYVAGSQKKVASVATLADP